ncbi:hypothetical protein GH733_015670 [Mirounga leonina]|nr:hypothetical protein GH733_015670 [Mirounga leonina]
MQDYCFEDWELSGKYLLQLCPRSLEALTVWPLGHQELILEGVEQLRALSSGLQTENLQSLTEGLLEGTYAFQNLVQGHLEGCAEPPADVLSAAVELAHEARTLLFWLNRYLGLLLRPQLVRGPFSSLASFGAWERRTELGFRSDVVEPGKEDSPVAEKESRVLGICSHVAGICHHILSCSPQELLEQRAVLERVQLDHPLVPADSRLQILPGDEIVQVNEQVVVGWPHKNVVRELLREPAGVSLVLKKVPVPKTPPQTPPPVPGSPQLTSPSLAFTALSPRASSEDVFAFDLTSNPRSAPSPTWTDSTSLDLESRPILPAPPATLPTGVAEAQEAPEQPDKSPVSGRNKSKGVATRLSRRRVSCRELGQPDCDGWLLLRKAPGGFMGPRWRRCWFVLKRHTLFWYCQPRGPDWASRVMGLQADPHTVIPPRMRRLRASSMFPTTVWKVDRIRRKNNNSEGALEGMVQGLRQGGVSLLGQPQPLTHEQWRSSFMRRNRDPQLNERAHRVRVLQSTLKAKLQELQALEEVLGDPELTGEKFRQWKERNQELYSEGLGDWGVVQAEGHSQVLSSDPREQSSHPLPSDPEEQSCLCPLTPESNLRPPDL